MKTVPTDSNLQITLNVIGEILGDMKNLIANKGLIITGETIKLENITTDSILVESSTTLLSLKTIVLPVRVTPTPFIQTIPSNVPLQLSLAVITGNGIIIEQKYRPIIVHGNTMTCNNRYVLNGKITCEEITTEPIKCIAIQDGLYIDDKEEIIYNCPCDSSSECYHIISPSYQNASFTIKVNPTYFIIQKDILLQVNNQHMNISTIMPTRDISPITATINGNKNTFTVLKESGQLSLIVNSASDNKMRVQTGTIISTVTNDMVTMTTSENDDGCIFYSSTEKCFDCSGNTQLIDNECVSISPDSEQSSTSSDQSNAFPSIDSEDNKDDNYDDHKTETVLAAILLVVLTVVCIIMFGGLVFVVLRKKYGWFGVEETKYDSLLV